MVKEDSGLNLSFWRGSAKPISGTVHDAVADCTRSTILERGCQAALSSDFSCITRYSRPERQAGLSCLGSRYFSVLCTSDPLRIPPLNGLFEMLIKAAAHSAKNTQFCRIDMVMVAGQDAVHFDGIDQCCQWICPVIIVEGSTGNDGSTVQLEVIAILNKSFSRQSRFVKGLVKIRKIG